MLKVQKYKLNILYLLFIKSYKFKHYLSLFYNIVLYNIFCFFKKKIKLKESEERNKKIEETNKGM